MNSIENKRKETKQPFLDASKLIDKVFKEVLTRLEPIKKSINTNVASYKEVQAAVAREKAIKESEKALEVQGAKNEEILRVDRIMKQLYSRLYGGEWETPKGKFHSAGCETVDDVKALLKIVTEKVPSPEKFVHIKNDYSERISSFKAEVNKLRLKIVEANGSDPEVVQHAKAFIAQRKNEYSGNISEKSTEALEQAQRETAKTINQAQKEVKEAGKGVKKILKFELVDINDVPKEWLVVDQTKVREWGMANKEELKKIMATDNPVMKGHKFYLESQYAAR
jgi:hypothetical protein